MTRVRTREVLIYHLSKRKPEALLIGECEKELVPFLEDCRHLGDGLGPDVPPDGVVHLQVLVLLVQLPTDDVGVNHFDDQVLYRSSIVMLSFTWEKDFVCNGVEQLHINS